MKISFNFKKFLIGVLVAFILIGIGLFVADKFPASDRFFYGYYTGVFFGCIMYSIEETKKDNK